MGKRYHKLVRDRIPEIIRKSGKSCVTEVLADNEYRAMLQEKLREECGEVLAASADGDVLEELADVLEVVYAMAEDRRCSREDLERIRQEKADDRGSFALRLLLTEVEE